MSSETQLKGDSLRRQLEASETYAKDHNLELVDSINGVALKDIGVSAFKGKNVKQGVLSIFLEALKNGEIEPNSVLLIESLDRLSREKLTEALPHFLGIINNDIEIVTLIDNQKYTKEIIDKNVFSLYVSLASMQRANEESETKSKRIKAAWENKRKRITSKVLTKTSPAWVQYSDKHNSFQLIEEKTTVVRKIFDMCINTGGLYTITRHLNEIKTPVFGTGKIWYASYVKRILENRAVIGEFQPHMYENGKRVKYGEIIDNYFPKVINEDVFLLAQAAISRRKVSSKGRKGKSFTNLFGGLTYCGLCGFRMLVRYRGSQSRSARYLTCSNKMANAGCQLYEWNLADFEEKMFHHLKDLDFNELIDTKYEDTKLSLKNQLIALEERLKLKLYEIENAIEYSVSTELSAASKQMFIQKFNKLESEANIVKKQINDLEKTLIEQDESQQAIHSLEVKHLISKIHTNKEDYIFRSTLNQYLLKMITKVELIDSKEEFMPWEFDEDDEIVKAFRLTFKAREKRALDKILNSKEFEQYYRQYNRTVKIFYKNDIVRYVMWGSAISYSNEGYLRLKKLKNSSVK